MYIKQKESEVVKMTTMSFNELLLTPGSLIGKIISVPFKDHTTQFVVVNQRENNSRAPEEEEECGKFIDIMNINNKNIMIPSEQWDDKVKFNKEFGADKLSLSFADSSIYQKLQQLKEFLPKELVERIVTRYDYVLDEISKNHINDPFPHFSTTTHATTMCIGDIWLPSISEIFGRAMSSDDFPPCMKLPYFRSKTALINDVLCNDFANGCIWTRSATFMNDEITSVYFITYNGKADYWNRTTHMCAAPASIRLRMD